jgi:putative ABC transport system permease protein
MRHRLSFSKLILQSIKKRPFRNIATILCFVVITGSLLTSYFLVSGAEKSLDVGMDFLGADILVLPKSAASAGEMSMLKGSATTFVFRNPSTDAVILTAKPTTYLFNGSITQMISDIDGVDQAAPQIFIGTLAHAACCTGELQVIAIDPERDFTIEPWMENKIGRPLGKGEVVIGAGVTGDVGSNMKFYGKNFTIVGRLDPSGMGMDVSAFIRMDDAYTMAAESYRNAIMPLDIKQGEISAVLIRVKPGADKEAIAKAVNTTVPGSYTIKDNYLAKKISGQLSATMKILYTIIVAVTLVSFPFMALISTMVANERKREFALIRAMGATKGFIFRLVLAEALVIAAIGGLAGVGISGLLLYLFEPLIISSLQMPFLWPSIGTMVVNVTITVLVAVGVGGAAALIPAYNSSRLEPYDAIRRSEL